MADYIEREELMKFPIRRNHYDKEHGNEHFINGIETVLEYAENLPTADVEQVRRWIPCSEGLPNDFEDVLCWYEYFRFGSYNRRFRKCGVGYQVNGTWCGEVSNGRNAKVLAWMPLPEPPEMDGGADNGKAVDKE